MRQTIRDYKMPRALHIAVLSLVVTVSSLFLPSGTRGGPTQEVTQTEKNLDGAISDPYHPNPGKLASIVKEIKDRLECTVTPLLNGKVLIAGGNPAIVENVFCTRRVRAHSTGTPSFLRPPNFTIQPHAT
jgi:hypothetical protein